MRRRTPLRRLRARCSTASPRGRHRRSRTAPFPRIPRPSTCAMPDTAERDASALDALCPLYGVVSAYTDIWGKTQRASDATRLALLKALGALDGDADLEAARRAKEREAWRTVLPPVAVFREDAAPYRLRLRFREANRAATYRWTLALENGITHTNAFRPSDLETLNEAELGGERYLEVAFDWRERLPTGYHRYALSGPGVSDDEGLSLVIG